MRDHQKQKLRTKKKKREKKWENIVWCHLALPPHEGLVLVGIGKKKRRGFGL